MKYIPRYQWGGVYTPSQMASPDTTAIAPQKTSAAAAAKKPDTPFKDKIFSLLDKNMLNSDRAALFKKYESLLNTIAVDGMDADPSRAIAFINEAGRYINHFEHQKKAEDEMKAQGSYRDIALSDDGKMFVQDKETHEIGLVDLNEYSEDRSRYNVLRNSDVSSLRSEYISDNEAMTASIQRGISIANISEKLRDTTLKLAKDAQEFGVTNEQGKALAGVAQGLAEGDYMKYKQSGNRKDYNTYLSFMWQNALNQNERDLLLATSVANGNAPTNIEAALAPIIQSYNLFTGAEVSAVPHGKDGSEGLSGGAGGVTELNYVTRFATNDGPAPTSTYLGRVGQKSISGVTVYDYGQAYKDVDGTQPMNQYVRADQFLNEAAGVTQLKTQFQSGKKAVFGSQELSDQQLAGLMVDTSDVQRTSLPVTASGDPDIATLEKMDDARARIKKGESAAMVLEDYFPGANATYDMRTGAIIIPGLKQRDFAVVKATANMNYMARKSGIQEDDPELTPVGRLDPTIQNAFDMVMAGDKKSGVAATDSRGAMGLKPGISKSYQGNLYIPIDRNKVPLHTPEFASKGALTNNTASYMANEAAHNAQEEFTTGARRTNFK